MLTKGQMIVNFFLLGNLLIPSTLFFLRYASSYTLGLGFVAITALTLILTSKKSVLVHRKFLLGLCAHLFFVIIHILISINAPSLWFDKFAYSIFLLIVVSLGAAGTAKLAVQMGAQDFHIIVKRCALLLLLIGFLGIIFGGTIGQFADWRLPLPPFSEPSHFVIAVAPFSLYLLASHERRLNYLLLASLFTILIVKKSAVMLVLIALIALVRAPFWAGIIFFTTVIFSNLLKFLPEYYQDRIAFWDGQNLTALVYLQGWQVIGNSVLGENILGYGFQQLGRVNFDLAASQLIHSLLGRESNVLDGGFVAAKIFGEFGLFAIPFVVVLLFVTIRSYFEVRNHLKKKKVLPPTILFARCVLLGYAIEFWFRGIGYFSIGGSSLLFSIAIIALNSVTRQLHAKPNSDQAIENAR